jgi:hypothetical protein
MKNAKASTIAVEETTVLSAWGDAVSATYDAAKTTVTNSYNTVCDAWEESSTTTKVIVVGGVGAVVGAAVYATLFR